MIQDPISGVDDAEEAEARKGWHDWIKYLDGRSEGLGEFPTFSEWRELGMPIPPGEVDRPWVGAIHDYVSDPEAAARLTLDDLTPTTTAEGDHLVVRFYALQDEAAVIFGDRQAKYGPKNIADSPFGALAGVVVRMHDKMARLRNFAERDTTEYDDEGIHDTLVDISNYAMIGRLVLRGEWPTND